MRDIFDTHIHVWDDTHTSDDVVANMDKLEVRKICLIAKVKLVEEFITEDKVHPAKATEAYQAWVRDNCRANNEYVARAAKEKPERIVALAFVDSIAPDAPDELERAVEGGCKGLKLFNIGHYPWDERCFPLYEKAEELGVPILFHAGILGDGHNSRFHRPAEYEIIKRWPNLKVILAHMAWPWTDEAIATAAMGPEFEKKTQIYLDLTPGAPLSWRDNALRLALDNLPDNVLIFGSDGASVGDYQGRIIREQDYLFKKLGVSEETKRKIYWENAMEFYGLKE